MADRRLSHLTKLSYKTAKRFQSKKLFNVGPLFINSQLRFVDAFTNETPTKFEQVRSL
jgi:hypothetical protein